MTRSISQLRHDLHRILRAGVDGVRPGRLLGSPRAQSALAATAGRRLRVVAAGKAAWPMAQAVAEMTRLDIVEAIGAGPRIAGHQPAGFEWYDAGHPDPNDASVQAANAALALARATAEGDCLLVLLSGGASALMAAPAPGLTLQDKLSTSAALMRAGVAIGGLNCVRKHLSAVKGGRLAAAAGASVTLAISDVHGPVEDDPSVIGSGPTVADPTTFGDAVSIINEAGIDVSVTVRAHLERGAAGELEESVKPGDARLGHAAWHLIGNRFDAIDAARAEAESAGYQCVAIPLATVGEARQAAHEFVEQARVAASSEYPFCVIAAGETTVRVTGGGRGGRNQEFALAAIDRLAESGRPVALGSAGTDGADGPTDAAGAIADGETARRAVALGLDARAALAANDSYSFFRGLNDLVRWGPTGTNVGDLQVILFG